MKILRKSTALLLAASMLLMTIPGTASVSYAQSDFTVVSSENFNDVTTLPSNFSIGSSNLPSAAESVYINTEKHADNLLHKNSAEVIGYSGVSNSVTYTFASPITASGSNFFIETEFDVYLEGSANYNFKFLGTVLSSNNFFTVYNTGEMYNDYSANEEKKVATVGSMTDKWTRLKYVIQLTGDDGAAVNKLVGIYADDELISQPDIAAKSSGFSYTGFSVAMSKGGGRSLCLDNIAVRTYNLSSSTDASPVPDKLALGEEIVALYAQLEENAGAILTNEYTVLKAEIDDMLDVYESATSTVSEVTAAMAEVDEISAAIEAAKQNTFTPVTSADFNASDALPSGYAAYSGNTRNSIKINTEKFNEQAIYKNVVEFLSNIDQTEQLNVTFDEPVSGDASNCYIETEFDIKTPMAFTLAFTGVGAAFYTHSSGRVYSGYNTNGTQVATITDNLSEWTHIRYVVQVTDDDGSAVNNLVGLYANGVNVLTQECTLKSGTVSYRGFYIYSSRLEAEKIYLDNIKVRKYNVQDSADLELIPDTYSLKSDIVDFYALLEENEANLSSEQYNAFKDLISGPAAVYTNANSNVSEIAAAKAEVEEISSRLEYTIANNSAISIGGVNVTDTSAKSRGYVTGGTLESVTLNKQGDIDNDLTLIAVAYDSEGKLASCTLNDVDTSFDTSTDISVGMSLPNDVREGRFTLMLWDENNIPYGKVFDTDDNTEVQWSVKMSDNSCIMETPPFIDDDGQLYVPAKYTANLFGLNCIESNGTYTAESDYGDTLTFSSSSISSNGNTYTPITKDGVIFAPTAVFEDNFGCSLAADEITGELILTSGDEIEKSYESVTPAGSVFTSAVGEHNITYSVAPKATTTSGSWFSQTTTSYTLNDVEVSYKIATWNAKYYESFCYHKAYKPQVTDGTYYGGIAGLNPSLYYYIRVKVNYTKTVTDWRGNVTSTETAEEIYDKKLKTTATTTPGIDEFRYDTNGELLLKPTYENIGYYIDSTAAKCEIFYRESGSSSWSEAYTPAYDGVQFRGSIVGLSDNTAYEVKAVLYDEEGNTSEVTATTTTWNDNPTIGQTIKLSDIYTSGGLMLTNLSGSENSWIKVINDTGLTINPGKNYTEAVLIDNCNYVIVEGLTVRGGHRYGINVSDNCSNIRITNCDVSGWGRPGVLNEEEGRHYYEGEDYNKDAGILLMGADNVTVERCYIHNMDANTNAWTSDLWTQVHPQGGCAIYYWVDTGAVIRYNDFIGNGNKRWNDAIEGYNNASRTGGASKNCDIYGNMFYMGEDDGMELEGGQMNVRVYNNRIEKFYSGISSTPNQAGPAYIFRNLVTNMGGSYYSKANSTIKIGGSTDGVFGMHYIFNNTFDSGARGIYESKYPSSGGTAEFHSVSRNNILVTKSSYYAFRNSNASDLDDNDYDLIYGKYTLLDGAESNGIKDTLPTYVDKASGNYHLADGSAGKGAGVAVPNFCENAGEDLGALAGRDENAFMPYRPVDMYADKYSITVGDGETASITFNFGDISETGYTIHTDNEWITPSTISGTASANSSFTLSFTTDLTDVSEKEMDGMILLRLDNGYSIPIVVKAEK